MYGNRLSIVSVVLLILLAAASQRAAADAYYNVVEVGQTFTVPEMGSNVGAPLQSVYCPAGTYVTGLSLSTGYVIDHVHLICSDSSTSASIGGAGANPDVPNTCSGAGNRVTGIQVQSGAFYNNLVWIYMKCKDGSVYSWGGTGEGGWGVNQPWQSCPQGYSMIGIYDHCCTGTTYISTLGVYCKWLSDSSAFWGYWTLGEPSGTTATDISGSANTGTYNGSPTLNVAAVHPNDGAKGVTFASASSQYMSTTTQMSSTAVGGGAMSMEVWFKTSTAAKMGIFGLEDQKTGTASTNYAPSLEMDATGHLVYYNYNTAPFIITTKGAYNDNNWHHVVATLGPAGMQLWVDTNLMGQYIYSTSIGAFAGYWRLGYCKHAGTYFNGSLDNFVVYKKQLNINEIIADFQQQSTISLPKRASCWELYQTGVTTSGIYTINPSGSLASVADMSVYCDMSFHGGGWTLLAASNGTDTTGPTATSITSTTTAGILNSTIMPWFGYTGSVLRITSGALSSTANFVTSLNDNPLSKMRSYYILNSSGQVGQNPNWDWIGPGQGNTYFTGTPSCASGYSALMSCAIYHASGNTSSGLHWWVGNYIKWNYSGSTSNLNLWVSSATPMYPSCLAGENSSCTAVCPAGKVITYVDARFGASGDGGEGCTCCNNPNGTWGSGGACSTPPTSCIGQTSCSFTFNTTNCGDTCGGYAKTGALILQCM